MNKSAHLCSDVTCEGHNTNVVWKLVCFMYMNKLLIKKSSLFLFYIQFRWKANWIGHFLRRNCFLQRVIEGKIQGGIEVTGRQGRRRRKLLDDLKERRRYSHLKEEVLDRTMCRARLEEASDLS